MTNAFPEFPGKKGKKVLLNSVILRVGRGLGVGCILECDLGVPLGVWLSPGGMWLGCKGDWVWRYLGLWLGCGSA